MVPSFCRYKDVVTAACTAHWHNQLQLLAALGILNPWLICRHTCYYTSHSSSRSQNIHLVNSSLHQIQAPGWLVPASLVTSSAAGGPDNACGVHTAQVVQWKRVSCTRGLYHTCAHWNGHPSAASAVPTRNQAAAAAAAVPEGTPAVPQVACALTPQNANRQLALRPRSLNRPVCADWSHQHIDNTSTGNATLHHRLTSSQKHQNNSSNSSSSIGRNRVRQISSGIHHIQRYSSSSSSGSGHGRRDRSSAAPNHTHNRPRHPSANSGGSRSTHSNSSSSHNGSSGGGGRSMKVASSVDVSYCTYPLPSYDMNQEEQDSLNKAKAVMKVLSEGGFMALIVGGWVRDKYLGRRASDIDIATNATPWEVKRLFRHVVELPRSTVKLSHQGEVLEVTSFRGISRAASLFGVAMDAELRDFTVNALYYDPVSDQVLDFVGGVPDAQAGVLRLTADPQARLREDPLRALRCVRFVTVLGLKLTPDTAWAIREAAHMCSVRQGLPPRRIWLELRKLYCAEQQQPGSWCRSLKLCYHLGLLHNIFPWLQDHHTAEAAKHAVIVAEKLQKLWHSRQQQQQRVTVPLSLLVAATLHPANREQAFSQLEQYFPEANDMKPIKTLLTAAALAHGTSTPVGTPTSSSGSSDPWMSVYASDHAEVCLDILAAWMPDVLADGFRSTHQDRIRQLAGHTVHRKQLLQARQDRNQHASRSSMPGTASLTASLEAAEAAAGGHEPESGHNRQQRQQEELTAAIQALVGDQVHGPQQVEAEVL